MATHLQLFSDAVPAARYQSRAHGWRTARLLVGLGAVLLLLSLAALSARSPVERAVPTVETSTLDGAAERPVFDGRGKWTGY